MVFFFFLFIASMLQVTKWSCFLFLPLCFMNFISSKPCVPIFSPKQQTPGNPSTTTSSAASTPWAASRRRRSWWRRSWTARTTPVRKEDRVATFLYSWKFGRSLWTIGSLETVLLGLPFQVLVLFLKRPGNPGLQGFFPCLHIAHEITGRGFIAQQVGDRDGKGRKKGKGGGGGNLNLMAWGEEGLLHSLFPDLLLLLRVARS